MEKRLTSQHFLDTSVARSLLLATQTYKQYLTSQLENHPLYVSNYVQMEMKRSYLMNIISFYFILRLETINTIGDALAFWSNRFKSSELKAILQLVPQLFLVLSTSGYVEKYRRITPNAHSDLRHK
jgi:hypothetical protein